MGSKTGIRIPGDPHLRRWMMFVDGENFTIRAQKFAKSEKFVLEKGHWYERDIFVWTPNSTGTVALTNTENVRLRVQDHSIRSYYYTTVAGDQVAVNDANKKIHSAGFAPKVFKKTSKSRRTKGVDIALATDMLGNAYSDNYDVAVLVAGDGDYLPLVEDVKRLGKVVYVAFFDGPDGGLSDRLRLSSDHLFDISNSFRKAWLKLSSNA